MTKILFINTNCSWNKGSAAQVVSSIAILRKFIPDANFSMISWFPSLDIKYSKRYSVEVIGYFNKTSLEPVVYIYQMLLSLTRCILWNILKKLHFNANSFLNERYSETYAKADIIIDLSGDSLADTKITSLLNCIGILPGILLRKPIVFFSQSIGPFRRLSYPIVKFCLNKSSLITARGETTKRYLENMKISTPIFLVADCAFLLKSEPLQRIEEILQDEGINRDDNPFIGIVMNAMLDDKSGNYVILMAQISDYLVNKLNAQVILVSHSFRSPEDGRFVAKKVYEMAVNKSKIKLIKKEYSANELKGIIGQFDAFIGARMHSNIAALSMYVPTIAISWSHKYYEIMKTIAQEKYVYGIKENNFKELTLKIDDLWYNRNEIRKILKTKIKIQTELALLGGKLVKDLVICARQSKIKKKNSILI